MKVYIKREFTNSKFGSLFAWIFMTILAIISVLNLFIIITGQAEYSLPEELIGSIVICGVILILYIRLFFLPTKYNLRLVYKAEEEYKGEKITNMKFEGIYTGFYFKGFKEFNCYSIGENDLEIDKKYNVITSRFEGFPIRIETEKIE